MPLLADAQAIYIGDTPADKVYLGDTLVWSSGPPTYADRIKSLIPISYWRLGEAVVGVGAVDEMNLYGCTYTGSPTLGVPGLVSGANTAMQVFGVANQGASAGNPANYQLATLTVEAWVKTSGAGSSYRAIIVKQDAYGLFAVDNVLSVYEWQSGQAIGSGVNIADGKPHHVVCVFQPSGSQMYLDGAPVGVAFNHLAANQYNALSIGYSGYAGQEFSGVIDEVAIYGRALTPAEIAGNYGAGPWAPTDVSGLGLWLEADKLTGLTDTQTISSWPDSSGYGRHAVPLGGAPRWRAAGMNGKPTVEWAPGLHQTLRITGWGTALTGKTEHTLFQVLRQNDFSKYPVITTAPTNTTWSMITEFSQNGGVYWGQTAGNYHLYAAQTVTATPTLLTYSMHSTLGPKFFKNGVQVTSYIQYGGGLPAGTPIGNYGADVLLGGYYVANYELDSHVAAMIWYDRWLSDTDRQLVEGYLKNKYGIA